MTGEMQKHLKLLYAGVEENRSTVEAALYRLRLKEATEGLDEGERELAIGAANIYQHILFLDFLTALHEDITRLTTELGTLKGVVVKMQEERG